MGKKLPTIFILMMLLMVSLVAADVNIKAGETYTLTSITQCYGDVEVNVRGDNPIGGNEYSIVQCSEAGANAWRCSCNTDGATDIKFETKAGVANTYDIAMEYYIAEKLDETGNDPNSSLPTQNALINDNNRRTISVGNIAVSTPTEEAPTRDVPQVNTEGTGSAMMLLGVAFLVTLLIVILVWRWMYNSRENQLDDEMITRNDALAFHNRSSENNGGDKPRMSFFDSASSRHADNQVPIHEQNKPPAQPIMPPEPPKNVYRGPEPKKEVSAKEINDFLENI